MRRSQRENVSGVAGANVRRPGFFWLACRDYRDSNDRFSGIDEIIFYVRQRTDPALIPAYSDLNREAPMWQAPRPCSLSAADTVVQ